MRGHDQTNGRGWLRASAWLFVLSCATASTAFAQARDEAAQVLPLEEPVDLAADRIYDWQVDQSRYIVLAGQVAVLQRAEGLRAERAAVRIQRVELAGRPGYKLEIYAEGNVRPTGQTGSPKPSSTLVLTTIQGAAVKPYSRRGLLGSRKLPADLVQTFERAFGPVPSSNRSPPVAARETTGPPRAPGAELARASAPGASPANLSARGDAAGGGSLGPPSRNSTPPAREAAAVPVSNDAPPIPTALPSPRESIPQLDRDSVQGDLPPLPPASQSAEFAGQSPDGPAPPLPAGLVGLERAPAELVPAVALRPAASAGSTLAQDPGKIDPNVQRAQLGGEGFPDLPKIEEPVVETPAPPSVRPPVAVPPQGRPNSLEPLPDFENPPPLSPGGGRGPAQPGAGAGAGGRPGAPGGRVGGPAPLPTTPILPGSQRIIDIYPLQSGSNFKIFRLETAPDGTATYVIQGGVNLLTKDAPGTPEGARRGTVDIQADNVVIWQGPAPQGRPPVAAAGGQLVQDAKQPLEVYLEGHVVFRQDENLVAGNGDQKTYRASRAYYDFRTERFIGLDAELDMFSPGLVAPVKLRAPRVQEFIPFEATASGLVPGRKYVRSDNATMTGSRFAVPGYRFFSYGLDMNQVPSPLTEPSSGTRIGAPGDPNGPQDLSWQIDARQNFFFMGPLPVFYWPHMVTTPDDLDPPIRNITPRFNKIFGQQLYTDWNGFKLLNIQKPKFVQVDNWNIDIDYLSARKSAALGSEIGYFGPDLFSDFANDFDRDKNNRGYRRKDLYPDIEAPYFGYLDLYGLSDHGVDDLGTGPVIITNGPPGAGKAGFQRGAFNPFQTFRGRVMYRHMQRIILDPDEPDWNDFRISVEAGYISDRHFLEQYYKRLSDTGSDQETQLYTIRQWDNKAWTVTTEANLQNWYTDTQWLPKLDYYHLGDNFFDGLFSYYQNTGVDWANTHTAVEVNNPNLFAFMPYDPVSNTSGPLRTGRVYTNQELDMPINLDVIRITPYVQGQFVGWNNQLAGNSVGRVWGAAGARANVMLWKAYPGIESELLNVHGLNHKINLDADYRNAFSNVQLNTLGVQDDIDDNTYEFVRRYFALTNYAGGLLPPQYDPRHLFIRRAISPVTGSTDLQASVELLQLGIHQRLQTKRGPEGRKRVVDWMILDLNSTYFPYARRDNFGKPFGQNMYNWEWFVGDRTEIYSTGWFEFFDITGQPLLKTNPKRKNDPFGMTVVNSGIVINRPPRGNITLGYTIVNTGTIATSALNVSYAYWFSPKWYGTITTSYDFGNAVLLNQVFSATRIGADYLVSLGVSLNPLQKAPTFGFEISPRLSPNIRLGSTSGGNRFDSRFAPTQ